jgi:hypothetical protein
MTFPTLIEHKNIWQFSDQWFDDCLSRYDQLLDTPLPPHFYGAANNENVPTFSSVDLLAWYSPWFTHTRKTYGIHLLDAGIVQFADQLVRAFKEDKSPALARSSAVLWAAYCLYCHELCHGWVEQFIGYCDPGQYQKKFRFHKNEEAICNTAVYGLQHNLWEALDKFYCPTSGNLQIAVNELKEMISSSKEKMLKALEAVMQNQPDGYKDYVPIDYLPLKHPVFLAKLSMLATDEYACNVDRIDKVLPSIADPGVLVEIPAHYIQSPAWINPSLFIRKNSSQDDRKPPKKFEILGENKYKFYNYKGDLYIELYSGPRNPDSSLSYALS